ncbi:hypothetical protein AKJ16_DCAP05586 [Drosera capensis]
MIDHKEEEFRNDYMMMIVSGKGQFRRRFTAWLRHNSASSVHGQEQGATGKHKTRKRLQPNRKRFLNLYTIEEPKQFSLQLPTFWIGSFPLRHLFL